jgi:hypothetical protein
MLSSFQVSPKAKDFGDEGAGADATSAPGVAMTVSALVTVVVAVAEAAALPEPEWSVMPISAPTKSPARAAPAWVRRPLRERAAGND